MKSPLHYTPQKVKNRNLTLTLLYQLFQEITLTQTLTLMLQAGILCLTLMGRFMVFAKIWHVSNYSQSWT